MADAMEARLRRMGATGDGPSVKDSVEDLIQNGMPKRTGATKGRKACTVCGKRPASMTDHFKTEADTHGPMSSENPNAIANLPGLDTISRSLGGLWNDRRVGGGLF